MDCNSACYSCFGPNSNQCTRCNVGSFFYKIDNACVQECPIGFYEEATNQGGEDYFNCVACKTGCSSCDIQTVCLSCA